MKWEFWILFHWLKKNIKHYALEELVTLLSCSKKNWTKIDHFVKVYKNVKKHEQKLNFNTASFDIESWTYVIRFFQLWFCLHYICLWKTIFFGCGIKIERMGVNMMWYLHIYSVVTDKALCAAFSVWKALHK